MQKGFSDVSSFPSPWQGPTGLAVSMDDVCSWPSLPWIERITEEGRASSPRNKISIPTLNYQVPPEDDILNAPHPPTSTLDMSWLAQAFSDMCTRSSPTSREVESGHSSDGVHQVSRDSKTWNDGFPLGSPFQSPKHERRDLPHLDMAPWQNQARPPVPGRDTLRAPVPKGSSRRPVLNATSVHPALYSVYVGGLNAATTEDDLFHHFAHPPEWPEEHPMLRLCKKIRSKSSSSLTAWHPEPFRVHSVKIVRDATGVDRVFGFVRLHTEEECDRALVEMQHTILIPRHSPQTSLRLYLGSATAPRHYTHDPTRAPRARRRASLTQDQPRTQRNISSATSTPLLHPTSQVNNASCPSIASRMKSAPPTGLECAQTTLTFVADTFDKGAQNQEGREHEASNKPDVDVQPHLVSALTLAHTSSALDPSNTTVFVGSLSSAASEALLHQLFGSFGIIRSVNIPRGQDCGFVQFLRKQDAARAITEMQGAQTAAGTLRLSWGRTVGEKAAARAAVRAGLRWVEDAPS